jgi:hypothetical protein
MGELETSTAFVDGVYTTTRSRMLHAKGRGICMPILDYLFTGGVSETDLKQP